MFDFFHGGPCGPWFLASHSTWSHTTSSTREELIFNKFFSSICGRLAVSQHVGDVVFHLHVAVVAVERVGGALEALPVRERPERVAHVRGEARGRPERAARARRRRGVGADLGVDVRVDGGVVVLARRAQIEDQRARAANTVVSGEWREALSGIGREQELGVCLRFEDRRRLGLGAFFDEAREQPQDLALGGAERADVATFISDELATSSGRVDRESGEEIL